MTTWNTGMCETNGVGIHYLRTGGAKPAVVLLHGLMGSGACWTPLARALEGEFDVVMPDARKLDRSRFSIVPIGSAANGFALKVDGVVMASDSCMIRLAAKVDALMAGASDFDADLIAKAIARRPWPDYEEQLAVFEVVGPWRPSRELFGKGT